MAEEQKASFKLDLEGNTSEVSADMATQLEALRQKVGTGQDAIKQMSAALRSLRGNTDDVKDAKTQLKAKIDAMKDAVSGANLQLLKEGTTFEKLSAQSKKLAEEQKKLQEAAKLDAVKKSTANADAMGNAISAAGGPVAQLRSRLDSLKEIVGGSGGAMGAMTLVTAGLVAAIAALTIAAIAGIAAFVKWVVVGADAARSLNLMREAATGSAKNAANLGTQVDALAGKVSTSKEKINELAVALARTRLSGSAQVDTLNAVGRAADAMGDDVGNAIKGIITRGQLAQRIQINPFELQGTGLKFQDIAAQLAVQMKVGVKEAQAALFEGRVKLDDGARALRLAVEKRFGEINARKLLSLDSQVAKFKERLSALSSDVKLEPLLKGFDELGKLFDDSTVTGATLKQIVTLLGNEIGPAFQAVVPIAKGFIQGLINGGLDVAIAFFRVKNAITSTFGGKDVLGGIDGMKVAMTVAKTIVYSFAVSLAAVGVVLATIGIAIYGAISATKAFVGAITGVWDAIKSTEWGKAIIDGLVSGITTGASVVVDAVKSLAAKVKSAFTGDLQIHSPSGLFKGYGYSLPAGGAIGVREGEPELTGAVKDMASRAGGAGGGLGASAGGARGVQGGGAPVVLNLDLGGIHIIAQGGANEIQSKVSDPSFLGDLTDAIERLLQAHGIPTMGAAT